MTRKPKHQKPKAETLEDLIYMRGLSLGELAKACGFSERSLYSMRRGMTTRPRVNHVAALARVLGVDVARVRAAIAASHD